MRDYSLSFTAASLMVHETEQILSLYQEHKDWDIVGKLVIDDNYLQKGTISTRKREFVELKKRLIGLDDNWINFSKNATRDEMKLFTLFLCAKTYRLIYEFLSEVVKMKLLSYDYQILNSDYERFIQAKMASSAKLQSCTESTINKIKQVIFKILEQATLIDNVRAKNIQRPFISQELINVVLKTDPKYLASLMLSDTDIINLARELKSTTSP